MTEGMGSNYYFLLKCVKINGFKDGHCFLDFILRRVGALCRFSPREAAFLTSCLRSVTQAPSEKGVYYKRKEFAPTGSKFFPFIIDSFTERRRKQFYRVTLPKMGTHSS